MIRLPNKRRRAARCVVTAAVGAGLSLASMAPQSAWARSSPVRAAVGPPDSAAASDGDLAQTKALYAQGQTHFDLFHYEKAVELWTRAYASVPDDTPWVKNRMVYNIATAQEKAYEMDREIAHLRQAALLVKTYADNYAEIYEETPETRAEIAKAHERIARLQARIEAAQRGQQPVAATTEPLGAATPAATTVPGARYGGGEIDGIEWESGYTPPLNKALLAENRRLAGDQRKTDKMIVAGYIVGAIGVGLLLVAAGGAAAASNGGGEAGRGVGYGGLALGLAGTTAGATLLGVGFSRRKKARADALSVTPTLGPGTAGLTLAGHF